MDSGVFNFMTILDLNSSDVFADLSSKSIDQGCFSFMSMVVEQLLGFYGSTDLSRNLPDPELALWNVKDEGLVVVRIEAARQVLQTIVSNFEL